MSLRPADYAIAYISYATSIASWASYYLYYIIYPYIFSPMWHHHNASIRANIWCVYNTQLSKFPDYNIPRFPNSQTGRLHDSSAKTERTSTAVIREAPYGNIAYLNKPTCIFPTLAYMGQVHLATFPLIKSPRISHHYIYTMLQLSILKTLWG